MFLEKEEEVEAGEPTISRKRGTRGAKRKAMIPL